MPQALPSHETGTPPQGSFDPTPWPTVGDALRRWWPLVVLAVLVFGGFGGYYAYSRKPVYQATSSLSVGLLNLTTQSVPGFAVGGEVVASGFSRSVQSDGVILPVARRLHVSPSEVRGRVSSSSIPSSPIFTITATGSSRGDAVALANAVSRSMVAYGRAHSGARGATTALLQRYRAAIQRLNKAKSRVATLRASGSQTSTGPGATGELARAKADVEAEQLRVDSIAQRYRTEAGVPPTTAVVQPLVNAQDASSDRKSRVKLYGAVGALAGLCLGTALAVLLTGRRYRRRTAP